MFILKFKVNIYKEGKGRSLTTFPRHFRAGEGGAKGTNAPYSEFPCEIRAEINVIVAADFYATILCNSNGVQEAYAVLLLLDHS